MSKKSVTIIFPHQLFRTSEVLESVEVVYLVEEFLFFNHYKFHKQKIIFHRASMKAYEAYLLTLGKTVYYIEATEKTSDIRHLIRSLKSEGITNIHLIDPTDNWLQKRINSTAKEISINWYENPLFINTKKELDTFFKPAKKKFFQTAFYKQQRSGRNVLMNQGKPEGGQWTYDSENRKKYPRDKTPPSVESAAKSEYHQEAERYVRRNFAHHYGEITDSITYPSDFISAESWLDQFFEFRFHEFGIYEDAIVQKEYFLNHSLLSPLINVGLLNPSYVIKEAVAFAQANNIPLNSTEGFVRQILGWREFIRGVYEAKGTEERTKNFWNFSRRIPASFYDGATGIQPVDDVIRKVMKTGYAHHIERLMILGNFMVLCEFNPNNVYQWFMELFIDAYDWVMVPNVYGMSLYADGGLMSTKPYISSSNYIMKMSDYKKGSWQETWDGLFWNFMDKHREFFLSNPRLGMLIRTFDKMNPETKYQHITNAKNFLKNLDDES